MLFSIYRDVIGIYKKIVFRKNNTFLDVLFPSEDKNDERDSIEGYL